MKVIKLHWISPVSCSDDSLCRCCFLCKDKQSYWQWSHIKKNRLKLRNLKKKKKSPTGCLSCVGSFITVTWDARGRGQQKAQRVSGCSFALQSAILWQANSQKGLKSWWTPWELATEASLQVLPSFPRSLCTRSEIGTQKGGRHGSVSCRVQKIRKSPSASPLQVK